MPTLTPAYGRNYPSAAAVITAYEKGKDFIFHEPASRYNGKYCSIRDFPKQEVKLRYNYMRDAIIYKAKDKDNG